jgi:large repetitive protein
MKQMAMRTKIMAIVGSTLVAVLALSGVAWAATDTTPPGTVITSGPTGTVSSTSASFSFSGLDNVTSAANLKFECSLDGAAFTSCTSPKALSGLSEGQHTFSVRAIDSATNVDLTPATRTWTVSTTTGGTSSLVVTTTVPTNGATEIAPSADIMAYFNHDMNASSITSNTFKIRVQGTTNWLGGTTYSVDNTISPPSANGSSESVVTLHPNGNLTYNKTYEVRIVGGRSGVKDVNGNILKKTISWTFTTGGTDTTPPDTIIDSGPTGTVSSTSASFSFSGSDDVTSAANLKFECSLDGAAFTSCTSSKSYSGLSEGQHTFSVRAIDSANNVDPTPATRTWTVDTIAPTVNVSPADTATGVARDTNVTATFSEALDKGSVEAAGTFTLKQGTSSVPAAVTYDPATKVATLDPSSALTSNTTYTATISTAAKDLAGNALGQEKTWSFTTGSAPYDVTATPNPLNLSPTDPLFCSPRQENLTVTNNDPGDVTFDEVTITGPDATYFSSNSQFALAGPSSFTVLSGNHFFDPVTFRPGSTPTDLHRPYSATLTYKDSTGATIGNSIELRATTACITVG